MATGNFVWCDLSSFRVARAKDFYSHLFGWTYHAATQPDGSPYYVAAAPFRDAAAIFEMPANFQQMGLPRFWMSYIAVDDIQAAVDRAKRLGGIVEVGPVAFDDDASIALIRDPLGAGFTIYQGTGLEPRADAGDPGRMVWNALYVSDANSVKAFYQELFGWRIAPDPQYAGSYSVCTAEGETVAAIHELREEIRGRFEFWGVHFAVHDLAAAKSIIEANGGEILYEESDGGRPTALAADPDGAAFFIAEHASGKRDMQGRESSGPARFKWKTVLALIVVCAAILLAAMLSKI